MSRSYDNRGRRWNVPVCVECDEILELCGCEPDWDGNEPKVDEIQMMPTSEHEELRKAANALFASWMSGSGTLDQEDLYDALDRVLGNKEQGG